MRVYKLTGKGKDRVRVVSQGRDELLDYLYEQRDKTATFEELKNVVGEDLGKLLRENTRLGLVEEVTEGRF